MESTNETLSDMYSMTEKIPDGENVVVAITTYQSNTGPKQLLARQPLQGRKNNSGLRLGELERDAKLSPEQKEMMTALINDWKKRSPIDKVIHLNLSIVDENTRQGILAFFMTHDTSLLYYQVLDCDDDNTVFTLSEKFHNQEFKIEYPKECFGCDAYDIKKEITWDIAYRKINIQNIKVSVPYGQFFCKKCLRTIKTFDDITVDRAWDYYAERECIKNDSNNVSDYALELLSKIRNNSV